MSPNTGFRCGNSFPDRDRRKAIEHAGKTEYPDRMIRRDHGERPFDSSERDLLSELAMNMTTNTQPTPEEQVVQRFRPYCCHAHGGHDGQVRLNPNGMYVRWQDYERLRTALWELYPGLVLDLRYADDDDDKDALRSRLKTVEEALSHRTDWDQVFRGTDGGSDCSCYGHEGDNTKCPQHGVGDV